MVVEVFGAPIVTLKDTLCIGVDDKAVMISGVEQHAVGGFRADAVNGQETFTDDESISLKHMLQ